MEMECGILKKIFEEIFEKISKFLHTSLRQNQKYAMDYSSGKKPILVLNFKAMLSALVKF